MSEWSRKGKKKKTTFEWIEFIADSFFSLDFSLFFALWMAQDRRRICVRARENDTFDGMKRAGRAGENNEFMNETRFPLKKKFLRFINFVTLQRARIHATWHTCVGLCSLNSLDKTFFFAEFLRPNNHTCAFHYKTFRQFVFSTIHSSEDFVNENLFRLFTSWNERKKFSLMKQGIWGVSLKA